MDLSDFPPEIVVSYSHIVLADTTPESNGDVHVFSFNAVNDTRGIELDTFNAKSTCEVDSILWPVDSGTDDLELTKRVFATFSDWFIDLLLMFSFTATPLGLNLGSLIHSPSSG